MDRAAACAAALGFLGIFLVVRRGATFAVFPT